LEFRRIGTEPNWYAWRVQTAVMLNEAEAEARPDYEVEAKAEAKNIYEKVPANDD